MVASLPKAKLVVGLSWRNLAHALGEEGVDVRRWAVLFPDKESSGNQVASRAGAVVPPASLEGIVVLDGTWSKAKTLWWRNPWLSKLNRLTLKPAKPSIYGSLRAEPKREYVSTLESVAAALTLCGEPAEIEIGLVARLSDLGAARPRRAHHSDCAPEGAAPKGKAGSKAQPLRAAFRNHGHSFRGGIARSR